MHVSFKFGVFLLLASAPVVLLPRTVYSQAGVSSGSVGVARAGFHRVGPRGEFMMPSPELFRIEEFINYHRHELPLPSNDQRVQLDIQRLGLENEKTVLQIGVTTPRANQSNRIPPLNLVLVIDESGSMSGAKNENLKRSLKMLVERFRDEDKLTLVGFEDRARVILECTKRTKIHEITEAIHNIHAEGSTNLHAGLMCGYEMALKNFDEKYVNRMIFLTDGNANVGVTESEEIAQESKRCIKRGVSLVTIGLGTDMNHGLLRELADSGRGLMHYIGDAKDIQKTFVDEFDSILSPAASKVRVSLKLPEACEPKIFGYDNRVTFDTSARTWKFKLDDLNFGATQVILAKIPSELMAGSVELRYVDALTGEAIEKSFELAGIPNSQSASPRRNYAIAIAAKALRSAAEASNEKGCAAARKELAVGIKKAKRLANERDEHVARVVDIAEEYLAKLDKSVRRLED